ncbi:MAG: tetratricopeptide repeat protein [Candidatus Coatesbacteria bacterium]|nr:MAG: tetratricopeptide repeat protein [Candidatus Coatesbacteria bacterium]
MVLKRYIIHFAEVITIVFISVAAVGCPRLIGGEEHEKKQAVKKLFDSAYTHYDAGNYEAAVADYEEIIEIAPNFAETYYHLGDCYNKMERYEDSYVSYAKASDLAPEEYEYAFNAGAAGAQIEYFAGAVGYFARAAELRPDDAEAYKYLGAVERQSGMYVESEEALSRALELKPYDGFALYNLALLYEEAYPAQAPAVWQALLEEGHGCESDWLDEARTRLGAE